MPPLPTLKKSIDAKKKAATDARKGADELQRVVDSISMALDSARGKAGLEALVKRLTDDLAEAKQMHTTRLKTAADAEKGAKDAAAGLAKLEQEVSAKQKRSLRRVKRRPNLMPSPSL